MKGSFCTHNRGGSRWYRICTGRRRTLAPSEQTLLLAVWRNARGIPTSSSPLSGGEARRGATGRFSLTVVALLRGGLGCAAALGSSLVPGLACSHFRTRDSAEGIVDVSRLRRDGSCSAAIFGGFGGGKRFGGGNCAGGLHRSVGGSSQQPSCGPVLKNGGAVQPQGRRSWLHERKNGVSAPQPCANYGARDPGLQPAGRRPFVPHSPYPSVPTDTVK